MAFKLCISVWTSNPNHYELNRQRDDKMRIQIDLQKVAQNCIAMTQRWHTTAQLFEEQHNESQLNKSEICVSYL